MPANLDSTTPAARYCLTFTAQWRADTFIRIPGGAHFTMLVIARVNMSSSLWEPGGIASPGLELVAEIGGVSRFLREIAAEAERGMAQSGLTAGGTSSVGTSTLSINMTQEYPLITFASMIAPSPDWFVGLHEYPLINDQGEWLLDTGEINLPAYDAGTEDGMTFSLSGVDSRRPRDTIQRLTVTVGGGTPVPFMDGTVNGNYLARIRFQRMQ